MADAVFILGEDLTNTAPMLALAVRQSVRQQPLEELSKVNIPDWNDAAARGLIQDKKGPLFIASIQTLNWMTSQRRPFMLLTERYCTAGFRRSTTCWTTPFQVQNN